MKICNMICFSAPKSNPFHIGTEPGVHQRVGVSPPPSMQTYPSVNTDEIVQRAHSVFGYAIGVHCNCFLEYSRDKSCFGDYSYVPMTRG